MPIGRMPLSLHTRISLVLTGLAGALLLVLAGLWLQGARAGIHEEVEAATKVSEQWLAAVLGELRDVPSEAMPGRVLHIVQPVGRIRANELQLVSADGEVLYRSPAPSYKAGRQAPGWFGQMLEPAFAPRSFAIGDLRLILRPDASRAVIDAWDDLWGMAVHACWLLALLFVGTRWALARALQPLSLLMQALNRTGMGRFDLRLPVFPTPELGRLSRAYNGMADRLGAAVDDNVRLETEREVAEQMQGRLQEERRLIARELHDELAQGITAVRALAGAIIQRADDKPNLHLPAQSIVTVTGEMQDGVRRILQRLRPATGNGLPQQLDKLVANWREQHPEIAIDCQVALGAEPLADELAATILRAVQEGLTNVVRHAEATEVRLRLGRGAGRLLLSLSDNGIGKQSGVSSSAGSGLGLCGMAERVTALGGQLVIESAIESAGGFHLAVSLPDRVNRIVEEAKP